jgi:hypothetical protein
MKQLLVVALSVLIAACSGAATQSASSQAFPVVLTHLGATVDPATAQVDVQITVKNGFPRTLKTLRILVALYDASGAQLGGDQAIEILGPIVDGQSVGPLEKVTSVRDRNFACLAVVRVEAVMMDYATRGISGADANGLVRDGSMKRCTSAHQ